MSGKLKHLCNAQHVFATGAMFTTHVALITPSIVYLFRSS